MPDIQEEKGSRECMESPGKQEILGYEKSHSNLFWGGNIIQGELLDVKNYYIYLIYILYVEFNEGLT